MIIVNGENVQTKTMKLGEFLVEINLSNQLYAVEVNQRLVPHKEREEYILQEGDNVEIVTVVGGG